MDVRGIDSAGAGSPLMLDVQLCFALYSAQLAMGRLYRAHLAPLGLTYPQYLVMLVLWQADGISVTALGQRLFLDSATLTPLLKRLQALGLIRRVRSGKDQRQVIISLTRAGLQLQEKARAIPGEVFCATGFPPEYIHRLKSMLEDLRANLHQAVPGPEQVHPHDAGPESCGDQDNHA